MNKRDLIDQMFTAQDGDPVLEYYPGSKRLRRSAVQNTADTPDHESWDAHPMTKRLPNGREVDLFPIGALATALGRPVVSIRRWEGLGYLPKAPYRFRASMVRGQPVPGKRLYSRAVVEATVTAFTTRGLMGKPRLDWSGLTELTHELFTSWTDLHTFETS